MAQMHKCPLSPPTVAPPSDNASAMPRRFSRPPPQLFKPQLRPWQPQGSRLFKNYLVRGSRGSPLLGTKSWSPRPASSFLGRKMEHLSAVSGTLQSEVFAAPVQQSSSSSWIPNPA
eukprot:4136968-Pyramimonas_sp.AAC.1